MQSQDDDALMSYLIDLYQEHMRAEGQHSDNTIHDRIRCLRAVHRDLPHGWVFATQAQLRVWLAGPAPQPPKTRGWSPNTRATYYSHLEAAYVWLVEAGQRPDNPMTTIRRAKVPDVDVRPAATDEETRIALTAPEPLATAVRFANYQGFRRAEICALEREHVTEELTYVHGKGGGVAVVPTHPAVWEHVRDRPSGPLIVDSEGVQYTPERLGWLAHYWFAVHIHPGIGLHYWRRRFGRWMRRYGDLELARKALRHKKIETTAKHYTPAEDDEVRAAMLAMPVVGAVGAETSRSLPGSSPSPASRAA